MIPSSIADMTVDGKGKLILAASETKESKVARWL